MREYKLRKSNYLDSHGQPLNRNLSAKRLTDRTVDELIGICKGIKADGIVNPEEADFLVAWLENSRKIIDVWPVNVLASRIEQMMSDNIIDEEERKELFELLTELTGKSEVIKTDTGESLENLTHLSTQLPLDKPSPEIIFDSNLFCFTGKFFYGPRNKCEFEIVNRGGKTQIQPTQKTNYLVIGLVGSTDWKHSTYGTKIEYAAELKSKGHPISIVSEEHWVKYL